MDRTCAPTWDKSLATDNLDLSNNHKCPFGQEFGHYEKGLKALQLSDQQSYTYGFHINPKGTFKLSTKEQRAWELLTYCWKQVLKARRSRKTEKPSRTMHARPVKRTQHSRSSM